MSAVKKLVYLELDTTVDKWCDDALRILFHIAQSCICSVVCNLVEHVVLVVLRDDVIGETKRIHR